MSAYPSNRVCPTCFRTIPAGYTDCSFCHPNQPAPQKAWEITVHSVPPHGEPEVARILSEILNITIEKTRWRIEQPQRLLAVGLDRDTVWKLKTELRKIGVTASEQYAIVRSDPFPGEPADPLPQRAEVRAEHPITVTPQIIKSFAPNDEIRTVVGLSLGRMNLSMAFVKAQGNRLLALPSMVSIDGQSIIPAAIMMKGQSPVQIGKAALRNYVINPDSVVLGFTNIPDLAEHQEETTALLSFLSERLIEVTATGRQQKLHISLGNSLTLDPDVIKLLVSWVNKADMQVDQVVPDAMAIVAAFQQQGKLTPLAAGQTQHILVFDGGSSYRITCVERMDNGEMTIIDTQDLGMGGIEFDLLMLEWLQKHLPAQPDPQTVRELAFFTQDFKAQMSRSFLHGRVEHNQFCVLPGLSSPLQISIRREEFEQLAGGFLQKLTTAFAEAPSRIGLSREYIDYVLLGGGGAGWYFIPKMIQDTLGMVPLKDASHEETIARGLAVYGLIS